MHIGFTIPPRSPPLKHDARDTVLSPKKGEVHCDDKEQEVVIEDVVQSVGACDLAAEDHTYRTDLLMLRGERVNQMRAEVVKRAEEVSGTLHALTQLAENKKVK